MTRTSFNTTLRRFKGRDVPSALEPFGDMSGLARRFRLGEVFDGTSSTEDTDITDAGLRRLGVEVEVDAVADGPFRSVDEVDARERDVALEALDFASKQLSAGEITL